MSIFLWQPLPKPTRARAATATMTRARTMFLIFVILSLLQSAYKKGDPGGSPSLPIVDRSLALPEALVGDGLSAISSSRRTGGSVRRRLGSSFRLVRSGLSPAGSRLDLRRHLLLGL